MEKSRRHVGRSKRKVKRTIQIEQKEGGIEINKKGEGSPQDEAEIEQALKKRKKRETDKKKERREREARGRNGEKGNKRRHREKGGRQKEREKAR